MALDQNGNVIDWDNIDFGDLLGDLGQNNSGNAQSSGTPPQPSQGQGSGSINGTQQGQWHIAPGSGAGVWGVSVTYPTHYYISRYHNGNLYFYAGLSIKKSRTWSKQLKDGIMYTELSKAQDYIENYMSDIAHDLFIHEHQG